MSGPWCSVSCNFEGRTRHSAIPHGGDALISLYVGTGRQRSWLMPNGEVEGPHDHASQAPRAHTVPRRPRRQTDHASTDPSNDC
jgi:hypothetical protein